MPGHANRSSCDSGPELAAFCRLGIPRVVLLNHETYYPHFGFALADCWNCTGDYGSHAAFQFLPLTAAARSITRGHIHYVPEFGEIFERNY